MPLNLADEYVVGCRRAVTRRSLAADAEPAYRGRIVGQPGGPVSPVSRLVGRTGGALIRWRASDRRKTSDWDPTGMTTILQGLRIGLGDQNATVRFQSIVGLGDVGPAGSHHPLPGDGDRARRARPGVAGRVARHDERRRCSVRSAHRPGCRFQAGRARPRPALDGLARFRGRAIVRERLAVLYDPTAPESLAARTCRPWPGMASCRPMTWPPSSRARSRWSGPPHS